MLNVLINYISPIFGLIGFINGNTFFMVIAIILNILPFITKAIYGQPYQLKFLFALLVIAFIVSKIFNLSIYKSLTIFLVFTNAILLVFFTLFYLVSKLLRRKINGTKFSL